MSDDIEVYKVLQNRLWHSLLLGLKFFFEDYAMTTRSPRWVLEQAGVLFIPAGEDVPFGRMVICEDGWQLMHKDVVNLENEWITVKADCKLPADVVYWLTREPGLVGAS